MLLALASGADNGISLMAEVGGKLAVRGHDLAGRMDLFPVTGGVRGNLGGQFRTSEQASNALNDLRRAQAEAEVRCF